MQQTTFIFIEVIVLFCSVLPPVPRNKKVQAVTLASLVSRFVGSQFHDHMDCNAH